MKCLTFFLFLFLFSFSVSAQDYSVAQNNIDSLFCEIHFHYNNLFVIKDTSQAAFKYHLFSLREKYLLLYGLYNTCPPVFNIVNVPKKIILPR